MGSGRVRIAALLTTLTVLAVLVTLVVVLWPQPERAGELAPPDVGEAADAARMGGLDPVARLADAEVPGAPQPLLADARPTSGPAAPVPLAPRTVSGRVVEVGGVPLPGARVYARWSGGQAVVYADEQGAFSVDYPAAASSTLRVGMLGYAGTPSLDVGEIDRPLEVRLSPLVHLRVRLLDDRGQPGRGVLRAFRDADELEPWDAAAHVLRSDWITRTGALAADDEGVVSLTVRAGGWTFVSAWRADDLQACTGLELVPETLRETLTWTSLASPESWFDLALPRRASLAGRVTPAGPDVSVVLSRPPRSGPPPTHEPRGAQPGQPERFGVVRLDASGEYAFRDVPPGDWVLSAWRDQHDRPAQAAVSLRAGEPRRVDLTFGAQRVSAIVRDELSGERLHDATIMLWREPEERDPRLGPVRPSLAMGVVEHEQPGLRGVLPPCDDEGRHDLSDLAPGRYLLWAWHVSVQPGAVREGGRETRSRRADFAPADVRWLDVPEGQQAVEVELPVRPATPMRVQRLGELRRGDVRMRVRSHDNRFESSVLIPAGRSRTGAPDSWYTPGIPPGSYQVVLETEAGLPLGSTTVRPALGQENVFSMPLREQDG